MFLTYYFKQFRAALTKDGVVHAFRHALQALLDMTLFRAYRALIAKPLLNRHAFLGEDVYIETLLGKSKLFYIDVGCNDPTYENMTYRYYRNGGEGINIDPNPYIIRKAKKDRPKDLNLNLGLSDESCSLTFFMFDNSVVSTFDAKRAGEARSKGLKMLGTMDIQISTLAQIFKEFVIDREVDVLNIDAEGFAAKILKGNDWTTCRPRIVVCEMEEEESEITHLLGNEGYELVHVTRYLGKPVNGIFMAQPFNNEMLMGVKSESCKLTF